jgi:TonB family protein
MKTTLIAGSILALLGVVVPAAGAQTVPASASLSEARGLYASAEYDRALSLLDGLLDDRATTAERPAAEFYRALCLLALGHEGDATRAVEALVAAHPDYRPAEELPPRVRTLLDDTRTRLLPMAIQTRYLTARAAYDQRDYASALRGFTETLELFSQPEVATLASEPPLSDLFVLADGFLELSAVALSPGPATGPATGPAPAPPPTPAPQAELPALPAGAGDPVPPPPAPPLYSAADRDVVPPVVVNQSIPAFPGPVRRASAGVIEVVIDPTGAVASARMLETIGKRYDELALEATRKWQYEPARLSGTPVHFVKRVQVSLVPNP